nr:GyrI-like domain-containing protein [Candidatus Krumholzibacteria bacterium]
RIFRGMVGESLQAHLRRLRLERAATRLATSDDPVIMVAMDAGFESHAAFSRAFKGYFDQTPSQWRDRGPRVTKSIDPAELLAAEGRKEPMDVKIIKKKPQRVAFARHTGPYDQCGKAWNQVCGHLGPQGRLGGDVQFIGLSYDDPEVTPPDKIRYDACVSVDDTFVPQGEIGVQELPGGEFALVTHRGPYENLHHTYAALMGRWLPSSGRRYKLDPTREVYLNSPESTPPEDLVTEIYLPLED